MDSPPSPRQISGNHNTVFEAYYKQMDPKCSGMIEAINAANFLKKSGLSDVVLSRIWDLSDPRGRGYLDKSGFFVALKLVALAQAGSDISMRNILVESMNAPKLGQIPTMVTQTIRTTPPAKGDWSIKPLDVVKYQELFETLQPVNGKIAGNKMKGVLMDSKLPLETLGKIWDLADQDKDGNLDQHEFAVAMHLVYQALDKRIVPNSLPIELQKAKDLISDKPSVDSIGKSEFVANFPADIDPPVVSSFPASLKSNARPLPTQKSPTIALMPNNSNVLKNMDDLADWVVTPLEKARFDIIFRESDTDKDGLVSGLEIKNIFLQSGVSQNCLAHIWSLCDTNQSGKLTLEQFALAMWLVERKKIGFEPPEQLASNMIPPSFRSNLPLIEQPAYCNPELQMINKGIDELARERRALEVEIAQKDADIRIKAGEVYSLQSELNTLVATLKQLENQKGEAQKRLDDLTAQVHKIREQCQKQETTVTEQQEDLDAKRSELQILRDAENALEKEYEVNCHELENLIKHLQDTQLQIRQVKTMVTRLLEIQRQMSDGLILCKAAIEANDSTLVSDYSLNVETQFFEAKQKLKNEATSVKESRFEDMLLSKNATKSDIKKSIDDSKSDAFIGVYKAQNTTVFEDNFSGSTISGFDDEFGSSVYDTHENKHPFIETAEDPFGDKNFRAVTPSSCLSDFPSDPFAVLHAPTSIDQVSSSHYCKNFGTAMRTDSPSPALPPKKSKQPPPRPAPPRPLQLIKILPTLQTENTKTSVCGSQIVNKGKITNSSCISKDFCDDPFKDYRYEDAFNINDPFDDEENDENSYQGHSTKETPAYQFQIQAKEMHLKNKGSSNFPGRLSAGDSSTITSCFEQTSVNINTSTIYNSFDDNFNNFSNENLRPNVDAYCNLLRVDEKTTGKKSTVLTAFNADSDDSLKFRISYANESVVIPNENFACFNDFDETSAISTIKVTDDSKRSSVAETET